MTLGKRCECGAKMNKFEENGKTIYRCLNPKHDKIMANKRGTGRGRVRRVR